MAEVTDQRAEALSLKQQGMSTKEIAEAIGRPASTVRRWFTEAGPEAIDGTPDGEPVYADGEVWTNGHATVDAETAARFADAAGLATPGQLTVDGDEVPAPEATYVEEIVVRGTTPLDFFNAGGKLPNKASVRFVGGKVGLEADTAFKKGDTIPFSGYATVVAATPRDKRDKQTGIVVECELQILAEIDDLRVGDGA